MLQSVAEIEPTILEAAEKGSPEEVRQVAAAAEAWLSRMEDNVGE